jgi:hypothetical protein
MSAMGARQKLYPTATAKLRIYSCHEFVRINAVTQAIRSSRLLPFTNLTLRTGLITERGSKSMKQEKLVEQKVTYTLFKDGQFYIIENVPARVDLETGEQYFSPQTVQQLQDIIRQHPKPSRVVETPVYSFS